MSCNCNSKPCSCASADCSCPPDYTVNPATLTCQGTTCEDTLNTGCIFTDQYLTCSKITIGSDLMTTLLAMDAKICQCGSCSGNTYLTSPLYYVDSRNSNIGTGAIENPFQTLELAYLAVIGSGSTSSPQHANSVVSVLGGAYSTTQNIYIPSTTWIFAPGSTVNFTGSGTYFVDTSVVGASAADFKIIGYLEFSTLLGSLVHNFGDRSNTGKAVYIEAKNMLSSSNLPIIVNQQTYSLNLPSQIKTGIYLKPNGTIQSGVRAPITSTGGYLDIDLGGSGQVIYGIDPFTGSVTGTILQSCITYANTDATTYKYTTYFEIRNGFIACYGGADAITISGVVNHFVIDNIKSLQGSSNTFCNIATITIADSLPTSLNGGLFSFLFKDTYLFPGHYATNTVILYSGTSPQQLPYLEMQDCVLYKPATISTTISLGLYSQDSGQAVGTKNTINGLLRLNNIPAFGSTPAALAAGLKSGDLFMGITSPTGIFIIP